MSQTDLTELRICVIRRRTRAPAAAPPLVPARVGRKWAHEETGRIYYQVQFSAPPGAKQPPQPQWPEPPSDGWR